MTVTATRFPENASDLPFGVSVLTAEAIRASGAPTVNEAVMKLLGVPGRVDFYGGGDYMLDLRGFGVTADANQVAILDGVRLSEADLGGTRLAGIPIESVERIEVIRGSAALHYGEGATGGAIVITTKARSGVQRRNQADVYAAVGSYSTRDLRGAATLAADGFSIDASANRRDSDNHRDNYRSRTEGASVSGQWRNDWLRAGLRHAYDDLDTGLPGALSAAQYADDPRQTNTPLDRASIRNRRSGAFGEATVGAWQFAVDAGWRDKSLASNSGGFDYRYNIEARQYALRARHAAVVGSISNRFLIGLDEGRWERTVLGDFGSVAKQRSRSLYLKDEIIFATGTRLSAGWRTENVHKDNTSSETNLDEQPQAWEIGIVQPLNDRISMFARYGRSFRLANVDEFGFTSPGLALATQTSHDAELGARWVHGGGRVELRLYRSDLTDEIGYDPSAPGPFGPGANVNFDPTRRQGLELEAAQALDRRVGLRVNAALRRARFTAGPYAGNDVPLAPRRTLSLRVDWAPAPGHRIDAGVTRVGPQSPDFDNACRIPGYTTADLRYAYQWGAAEMALRVDNLADARYYTRAFACDGNAPTSIYPEAGRAFTASLRLHF